MNPGIQAQIDDLNILISQLTRRVENLRQEMSQARSRKARVEELSAMHKRAVEGFYADHHALTGIISSTRNMSRVKAALGFAGILDETIRGNICDKALDDIEAVEQAVKRELRRLNDSIIDRMRETNLIENEIAALKRRVRLLSLGA